MHLESCAKSTICKKKGDSIIYMKKNENIWWGGREFDQRTNQQISFLPQGNINLDRDMDSVGRFNKVHVDTANLNIVDTSHLGESQHVIPEMGTGRKSWNGFLHIAVLVSTFFSLKH